MTLNISEFQVSTSTRKLQYINFDNTIDAPLTTRKEECRDLGAHPQTNLKITEYIAKTVNKSYRIFCFVTKNTKKIYTGIKLCNALVRPTLEYASVFWSPQTTTHSEIIEKEIFKSTYHLPFQ